MNKVAADLKFQAAENERLRQAVSTAVSECLAAREANALLSEQIKSAQREAESLHKDLEAVRAQKAEGAAEAGASAVLAEIKFLPDSYSGRVLSWLVRRTPLVSRTVGNPVVYVVHLDWFFRPPPECLDHHQLRPR